MKTAQVDQTTQIGQSQQNCWRHGFWRLVGLAVTLGTSDCCRKKTNGEFRRCFKVELEAQSAHGKQVVNTTCDGGGAMMKSRKSGHFARVNLLKRSVSKGFMLRILGRGPRVYTDVLLLVMYNALVPWPIQHRQCNFWARSVNSCSDAILRTIVMHLPFERPRDACTHAWSFSGSPILVQLNV